MKLIWQVESLAEKLICDMEVSLSEGNTVAGEMSANVQLLLYWSDILEKLYVSTFWPLTHLNSHYKCLSVGK